MKGTGVMGPDGKSVPKPDPDLNLGVNESIRSLIDEQCTRIIYLKKYAKNVEEQAEREVGELKQMAEGLAKENTRLKILLKTHGIDYK